MKRKVSRFPDDSYLEKLFSVIPNSFSGKRNKMCLKLMANNGLRIQEAIDLKLSDLDLESGYAIILGKGNKERYTFFHDGTIIALQRWIDVRGKVLASRSVSSDVLFPTFKGGKIDQRYLRKRFMDYQDMAGLSKKYSPHSLRHRFAVTYYRLCHDPFEAQRALGHSSIRTTQIYIHTLNEDMRTTVRKMQLV